MPINKLRRRPVGDTVPTVATGEWTPFQFFGDFIRWVATTDVTRAVLTDHAEVLTAATTLTRLKSGTTFFLNSATEFAVTLPAPAIGLQYKFIVTAAPSQASYTVVTEGGCQVLAGHVLTSGFADSGSDVETAATGTTITFVDSVSVVGDYATVISDGTSWFASCVCAAEAGITITG